MWGNRLRKLVPACVAALVLGLCLAGAGCQTPTGQRIMGGSAVGYQGPAPATPASFGYGQSPDGGVIQTGCQFPGGCPTNGQLAAEGAPPGPAVPPVAPLPVEFCKVSLPPYMIEPPDILLIDTVRMIPRPPYRIEPLDVLLLQVSETLPGQPIGGTYTVSPEGTINLGYAYASVRVAGLSLEEAQAVIRNHLSRVLTNPKVSVALSQSRIIQQVRGEHLVRPDGTINLGTYGSLYVAGMTLMQAKAAIEGYMSQFVLNPEISLDVAAYNSKVYYVITDGAGYGEQVLRFPATGNETVLDAISNIGGLPIVASRKYIWVARPTPRNFGCYHILPVDWEAITQGGATDTNYQIFPGDRIYVRADHLIRLDNTLAKIISPIERLFGITLLGNATVQSFRNTGTNGFVSPFIP